MIRDRTATANAKQREEWNNAVGSRCLERHQTVANRSTLSGVGQWTARTSSLAKKCIGYNSQVFDYTI